MNVRKLMTDDRAVSPVVGVALLIAITVILAAVIGGVVLGLDSSSAEAPQASLQFEHDTSENDTLTINHKGGDTLEEGQVVVKGEFETNETQKSLGTDLSAGTSADVTNVSTGQEISVVWQDPNSDEEAVLSTYEIDA